MKAHNEPLSDKKGHLCPPSCATHPRDRWESLFVFSFISKFTQLRGKVEGLNSPMESVIVPNVLFRFLNCVASPSFEEALLSHEPHTIMTQILTRFVLNLRPGTRNIR
jgi:hypothetical protein